MGFNSGFKGLSCQTHGHCTAVSPSVSVNPSQGIHGRIGATLRVVPMKSFDHTLQMCAQFENKPTTPTENLRSTEVNAFMICVDNFALVLVNLRYWSQIYSSRILECSFVKQTTNLQTSLSENIFSNEEILTCLQVRISCYCNKEEALMEKRCVWPPPILMP